MRIIPAIDIIGGRCVRLTKGDYGDCKVYADDPADVAKSYERAGFSRLHVVDLDGAKASGVVNLAVLERICRETSLRVDFGGGVKSQADLDRVFDAGAAMACIGSVAVTDVPMTRRWLERYTGERIVVGADVLGEKVCIHGWKTVTDTSIYDLAEAYAPCLKYLMCTDISRDGMLGGAAEDLYSRLMARLPGIRLIASGGVGAIEDVARLEKMGVPEVIVGKAIYEGRVSLAQLMEYEDKKQ